MPSLSTGISRVLFEVCINIAFTVMTLILKLLSKGTSKGVVTAGLIGGRVGNKGAVGISLNIDGTTFLFVNAHLAGELHASLEY